MTAEVIQFVPKANLDRAPLTFAEEARFYEHLSRMPAGSYRGSYLGVPFFEVDELHGGDCA